MKYCVLLAAFVLVFAFTVQGTTTQSPVDAKAVFETKCSACHNLARTTNKTKSQEDWQKTVTRMKNKRKAQISDDDARIITEYLAKTYGKPAAK